SRRNKVPFRGDSVPPVYALDTTIDLCLSLSTGCAPDPTAIQWLLLSKYDATGPGIFASVTFIQRVNTVGGLPPNDAGSTDGEVREVPYTAEYYFYRQQ
ncbi:MAG TPA: DUF3455 domain-containing protein, partial [Pyrinomonadaceae bacterium]